MLAGGPNLTDVLAPSSSTRRTGGVTKRKGNNSMAMATALLSVYATPPSQRRGPQTGGRRLGTNRHLHRRVAYGSGEQRSISTDPSPATVRRHFQMADLSRGLTMSSSSGRTSQTSVASESTTSRQLVGPSQLFLNTNYLFFGASSHATITVTWKIVEEVNLLDWIGMYAVDETNPFHYLDYKSYGTCGRHEGKVTWTVKRNLFDVGGRFGSARRRNHKRAGEMQICFKYYEGITGVIRAVSPPLTVVLGVTATAVHSSQQRLSQRQLSDISLYDNTSVDTGSLSSENSGFGWYSRDETSPETTRMGQSSAAVFVPTPLEIIIKGIECRPGSDCPLKSNGQWYAKVQLSPISYKTTVLPSSGLVWTKLNFTFAVDATKELEVILKERNWAGKKTFGRVNTSVGYLLEQFHADWTQNSYQYAFVVRRPAQSGKRSNTSATDQTSSSRLTSTHTQLILTVEFRGVEDARTSTVSRNLPLENDGRGDIDDDVTMSYDCEDDVSRSVSTSVRRETVRVRSADGELPYLDDERLEASADDDDDYNNHGTLTSSSLFAADGDHDDLRLPANVGVGELPSASSDNSSNSQIPRCPPASNSAPTTTNEETAPLQKMYGPRRKPSNSDGNLVPADNTADHGSTVVFGHTCVDDGRLRGDVGQQHPNSDSGISLQCSQMGDTPPSDGVVLQSGKVDTAVHAPLATSSSGSSGSKDSADGFLTVDDNDRGHTRTSDRGIGDEAFGGTRTRSRSSSVKRKWRTTSTHGYVGLIASGSRSSGGTPVAVRARRPGSLSIDANGQTMGPCSGRVAQVTNVWLCNSDGKPERLAHRSAAVVLKSPQRICTPCLMSQVGAPGSSKHQQCRCNGATRKKEQRIAKLDIVLPPNWEARVDRHGRLFFVDHVSRTTSWERPTADGEMPLAKRLNDHAQRRQMDRRYVCLRRTIASSFASADETDGQHPDGGDCPAVRFLRRPDFIMLLHANENARRIYSSSPAVQQVLHRIRKSPTGCEKFTRYQHNKDLVALLNQFADTSLPLPVGWQTKADQAGKAFFVDHRSKRTTYIDPRLPLNTPTPSRRRQRAAANRCRARSAPPNERRLSGREYHERVVEYFRAPNFTKLLHQRLPSLAGDSKLKKKMNSIIKNGLPSLQKYSNDLDVITVLSVFEDEISGALTENPLKGRDSFEDKLADFYDALQQRGYGQGPGKLKLTLRREHLLTDAFEQILAANRRDLQRCKICVAFDDEDGLDYGGPSREFFFLLSRELFNPYYGLFEYSANDTYTVQISPMSQFVDNHMEWFYFCGRVLGLALIHRYLIDTFFTRAFYKFLLKRECSVSDLEGLDSQFHSSLQWLMDNEVTVDLQLTYSVNEEIGGKIVERELIPGGADTMVTEENKEEYVRRMIRWRLDRGVRKQGHSMLRGFYEVVDGGLVGLFDARELELVLSGTVEIDLDDWRANVEYKSGYSDLHVVINWFWHAVAVFTNAQRLQLLQFVTGTSSIPYEGFCALRGSHGPKRFTVEKWGSPTSLPRAHTCFNRLDLPPYTSYSVLHHKLLMAISESGCYGIE